MYLVFSIVTKKLYLGNLLSLKFALWLTEVKPFSNLWYRLQTLMYKIMRFLSRQREKEQPSFSSLFCYPWYRYIGPVWCLSTSITTSIVKNLQVFMNINAKTYFVCLFLCNIPEYIARPDNAVLVISDHYRPRSVNEHGTAVYFISAFDWKKWGVNGQC